MSIRATLARMKPQPAIKLRAYQQEAVDSIWSYFQKNDGNPLVALPTGTGKSLVIAFFLKSVFEQFPKQRVMILTHVKELIRQDYDELLSYWAEAPAGIYSAGLKQRDTEYPITFAGIASIHRKPELFGHVDLIIIDEAHLVSPTEDTMYQKFIGKLKEKNPYLKVIGLTATAWRLSSGLLTDKPKNGERIFTDICYDGCSREAFAKMIDDGYLCELIPKRTKMTYDTSKVHMRGGEFVEKELQELVNSKDAVAAAIKEAVEDCGDRKHWLVFATGVQHTEIVCKMLNDAGIPATYVHSKLSDKERDAAIFGFKSGKFRAIVNNNVLTTGFNFPAIDLILCLRPTMSSALWVQMLGRGTRPSQGKKNCIVLDFAGNTANLGPINDPIIKVVNSDGKKRKVERICPECKEKVVPNYKNECPKCGTSFREMKVCEECSSYVSATTKVCPHCQHAFPEDYKYSRSSSGKSLVVRGKFIAALPTVGRHDVKEVVVMKHNKVGKPPSLRVSYYCTDYKKFDQYVCLEHEGFAQQKARRWWFLHKGKRAPMSVDDALRYIQGGEIMFPSWIEVQTGGQYPEILSDGYSANKPTFKVYFSNEMKKAA